MKKSSLTLILLWKTSQCALALVCLLIDNYTRHHSGQIAGDSRGTAEWIHKFWPLMTRIVDLTIWCQFFNKCQSGMRIRLAIASWIWQLLDNVMTKFMINNRTDAWKTHVHLFFTITNCQTVRSRSLPHRKIINSCVSPLIDDKY